ncbi:MAG: lytic transglycosylase domain-containing protein [Elusimicrobia bacterium]|nr:lytic transglycosylase domain-containing protein [Elusimicrobiota bacterium]
MLLPLLSLCLLSPAPTAQAEPTGSIASELAGRVQAALAIVPAALPGAVAPEAPQDLRPEGHHRELEEQLAALIDELIAKDPTLFNKIRTEGDRIRTLPTHEARVAAVQAGYPRLEADLNRSLAQGRLSPEGAARWAALRAQTQAALADGTLFDWALFAGQTFDNRVQGLLAKGTTILDPERRLPEKKAEYMRLSKRVHDALAVPGNSTTLKPAQLDKVFTAVGKEFGIRPEFLKYMAKTESGLRQAVPSNPAAVGIMQIESVHKDAYAGARNVANDTITNIVYGGLLRAQTDRAMANRFLEAGLAPPTSARVVEFLGDLAYNRGPGLLKYVAQNAAQQAIDVNTFAEYIGGRGGSYTLVDGGRSIVVIPGPGTGIDQTGGNSVLERSSEAVGRVAFSQALTAGLGDRNGDGRVDHLDVWLTRGIRYLSEPKL